MKSKLKIAKEFAESLKYPEIKNILLFGSVARGRETENSDIDILISCKGDRFKLLHKVMDNVVEFLSKYGEYISVKVLSVQDIERLKNTHFILTIKKEGIKIG
ncbi:MAG: nucleotidyltransferase domain-containing protein [Candidatus Altiarchaeales archaeon HGW-Altiarchaeales-3]|nr:MAG: nucleotidyltransferase domain-containing protein [Candidatus Altiarchaeales archaeon HGW-Altiarchaeales-3]